MNVGPSVISNQKYVFWSKNRVNNIIKYLEFVKNVLLLPRSTMLFTTHWTYLGLFRYNIFMEETNQCIKHQNLESISNLWHFVSKSNLVSAWCAILIFYWIRIFFIVNKIVKFYDIFFYANSHCQGWSHYKDRATTHTTCPPPQLNPFTGFRQSVKKNFPF